MAKKYATDYRIKAKHMKLGVIKTALAPLLDDAYESEKLLAENRDSQFIRRLYIRSVFSYIEGSIWVLKQVCLNAKSVSGEKRKITLSEYSILAELSYDLKSNGDIKTTIKILSLLDNIKFTFKTINRLFQGNINLGTGTESWNNLITAKNVRNRITHPKSEQAMTVSNEEMAVCEAVCTWFNILVHQCFQLFLESGKARIESQV